MKKVILHRLLYRFLSLPTTTKVKKIFAAIFLFSLLAGCNNSNNKPNTSITYNVAKAKSFTFKNSDSIKYYNSILQKIAGKNVPEEYALLKYCEGLYFLTAGLHSKAITNFEDCAQLFAKQKNDSFLSYSYLGMGNCYKLSGHADEAIKNYLMALPINEKNLYTATLCYANLAETYQQKNDLANAKKYLRLAKLNEPYGSRTYVSLLHFEANIFGMSGMFDSALLTDYKGLELAAKYNYPDKFTSFYDNIARCFMEEKNYDSATHYFKKCIYVDSINGRVQLMADTYSQMVNVYGYKNEPDKMMATALYANQLCDSTQYLRGKYAVYDGLNNYYTGTKNWQQLAVVKDSMQQIYKRLINEETETKIAKYNVEFETSKKEQLIATQQNKLQKITYLTGVITLIALLLGVSILAIYKNYKTKKSIAVNDALQKQKDSNVQAVFESEQTERIRIARDLHDSIGQKLSVLKMYLNNRENDAVKTPALLDDTIQEVRNISHNLLPEELNFGFLNTIKSDIEKIEYADVFKITTTIEDAPYEKISLLASLNIVRIFRELLANMVKHSGASQVFITLHMADNIFHLQLKDDGIGINKNTIQESKGIGWKNIFARTNMLNGTINIDANEPAGSNVQIQIPIA